MTPTEQLLPCPFCGGAARLSRVNERSHAWQTVYVFCNGDCGARGETFDIHMDDTEDPPERIRGWAIAAWNRRSALEPTTDAGGRGVTERAATFLECADEARRYAAFYPEASDGRNTFMLLASDFESRAAAPTPTTEPTEDREETGRG